MDFFFKDGPLNFSALVMDDREVEMVQMCTVEIGFPMQDDRVSIF